MPNDPKVRILYDDFYKEIGVSAAWTPPAQIRIYRDALAKGKVKPKPRNTAADKAKLARIANKASEVMVKVSGRTHDSGHLKAHMDYITRNGQVTAETDYGEIKGKEAIKDLHDDWSDDELFYKGQLQFRQAPLSVNMVLSMPPDIDRDAFRNAVRDFVNEELRPRVDVMVAFHDDTQHPHAHVTVRGRQHSGKAFNPGKAVLARYREQFASALRNRGIEAEATPRYARGRTLKAERSQMRQMRARGLTPDAESAAIQDAYNDLQRAGGPEVPKRPWEDAARTRHAGAKQVYSAAARELATSTSPADRQLAREVDAFVQSMAAPTFAHDLYKQALMRQLAERGKQRTQLGKKRDGQAR